MLKFAFFCEFVPRCESEMLANRSIQACCDCEHKDEAKPTSVDSALQHSQDSLAQPVKAPSCECILLEFDTVTGPDRLE
jgi:hypothetical protein